MARTSQRGVRGSSRQYLRGMHAIGESLRARRRELHRLLIRRGSSRPELEPLVRAAREAGIPIEQMDLPDLAALADAGEASLQGILLEAGPLPEFHSVRALCRHIGGSGEGRRLVALDGVEDPQNVGSLTRVADAAGAHGLVLTERRAPPLTPALARASAGAIEWQPVARVPNLGRALSDLQNEGFWLLGAHPAAEHSVFELPGRLIQGDLVLVLGAEGKGLRPSVLKALDHPLRIPMLGEVASLNVATAGAIVLFELLRRQAGGPGH